MEKTGERRPWKSQERFPLSHSFNNNKLDDRDHFQQNAKTSVASLRGLIGSSRNIDRHHSGMLIDFIGIPREKHCRRKHSRCIALFTKYGHRGAIEDLDRLAPLQRICFFLRRGGLKSRVSASSVYKARTWDPTFLSRNERFEVSYQCHMNCDEWRQKVNKDRKEKVNQAQGG